MSVDLNQTISLRVPQAGLKKIDDAAQSIGATRSEIVRELLLSLDDRQIQLAAKAVQESRFDTRGTLSLADLKRRKQQAEQMLGWIESELSARAMRALSGRRP
jgi:Arc/MetJ-type ribon-helix-helix transcriptional regulator